MKQDLASQYSFQNIEEPLYQRWEESNLFHAEPRPGTESFTIVIPPPNVTGILHMGHALNNTIQDILIRFQRMQGKTSLWMPGTDHAGIATQNVVERKLAKEGSSRKILGREKFLEQVWQWKQEYGSTIIRQLKRLGCSCDWQRTRFTMDEAYSDAVMEVFVRLFRKDLIYRGLYIINWCPRCQTALSDEEAPHHDVNGHLWHIKYQLKDSSEYVVVATTRPETMLGDTAVAVNPKDERYRHLIGKTVILPLMEREIVIISDDLVDPAFGTGCVKVTPAHDPNDYVMGKRHNLAFINILHPDGRCNEQAGEYADRDRFEAREAVIEDLRERKLLVKVDEHRHAVGHCYRCHTVVEPYLSKQWFVKMKPLAEPATAAVKDGRITFHPQRWTKVYLNWMENIQDWCISRQIWWGHRIPAWYCAGCNETLHAYIKQRQPEFLEAKDSNASFEIPLQDITILENIEPIVTKSKPQCTRCKTDCYMVQDPQVLDTWFSSWLWPFATFGWPFDEARGEGRGERAEGKAEKELRYFYPTSVLVTAQEIIFFWVARMIMAGIEFQGGIPFQDVYIHGTVRDDTGKKMSKSLGNVIDPLEVIKDYGADALRFSLISITAMGQDIFLSKDKFDLGRNFCNKIWNASRFILMKLDRSLIQKDFLERANPADLTLADRWVLSRLSGTIGSMQRSLGQYRFNEAAGTLYEFFWHVFCDWYIELAKLQMDKPATHTVLYAVLEQSLRLMHPFMPFISEFLWQQVAESDAALVTQSWPRSGERWVCLHAEQDMQTLIDAITAIRNLRSEHKMDPKLRVNVTFLLTDSAQHALFDQHAPELQTMARIGSIAYCTQEKPPQQAYSSVFSSGVVFVVKEGGIDAAKEAQRLQQEIERLAADLARREALLQKPGFAEKAPAALVEQERRKCAAIQEEIAKLTSLSHGTQT